MRRAAIGDREIAAGGADTHKPERARVAAITSRQAASQWMHGGATTALALRSNAFRADHCA